MIKIYDSHCKVPETEAYHRRTVACLTLARSLTGNGLSFKAR